MAIFLRKKKSLDKRKTLSVVLLAGLFALAFSYFPVAAQGPVFNAFPVAYDGSQNTDLPLLDARNKSHNENFSSSQSDHDAGVQASAGEFIEVSIYYHNSAANENANIAQNTRIQAFASPSLGQTAATHTLSASISANNAAAVTSSSEGGNINVHIQGGTPLSLSLVPGSTSLRKDCGPTPACQASPQILPDTIFSSGVSIGDVRGCFEFRGFINFKLQISQPVVGDLQIKKEVKNVTDNTAFSDTEVAADPGETVEFRITVTAANNPISNVSVRDSMDTRLSLSGNVTVDGNTLNNIDFFSGSGSSLGNLSANQTKTILFRASVSSSLGTGTHVLTNVATASVPGKSVQDGANVRVVIQPVSWSCSTVWEAPLVAGTNRGLRKVGDQSRVTIRVSGPASTNFVIVQQHASSSPVFKSQTHTTNAQGNFELFDTTVIPSTFVPGDYNVFVEAGGANVANCPGFKIEQVVQPQIDVEKTVRSENVGGAFVEQVEVVPNQKVKFQIIVKNRSDATLPLENVVLKDVLPGKLTFVTGSLHVDAIFVSEGAFFGIGNNIGTIGAAGGQQVITFQADVKSASNFAVGACENLFNSATATSGSQSDSDTASVRVCVTAVQKQPGAPGPRPQDP